MKIFSALLVYTHDYYNTLFEAFSKNPIRHLQLAGSLLKTKASPHETKLPVAVLRSHHKKANRETVTQTVHRIISNLKFYKTLSKA